MEKRICSSDHIWPIKLKIFTICCFAEKVVDECPVIASEFQAQEFMLLELEGAIRTTSYCYPILEMKHDLRL